MQPHKVVPYDEWLAARKAHLKNEKALTRMRDLVSAERRAMPWVKIEKRYVFDTDAGQEDARRAVRPQQPAHHAPLHVAPRPRQGCSSCSLEADHAEGALVHLVNHDVSYVRCRARRWKSCSPTRSASAGPPNGCRPGTTTSTPTFTSRSPRRSSRGDVYYNYQDIPGDQAFDELPGLSVFYKDDDGDVFHTYSSYARGNEEVIGAFIYLDMTPKGRNEKESWIG